MGDTSYVAALDVGTTTIRCHIINSAAETVGTATTKTTLLYPQTGYVEIDPHELWNTITTSIKQAISDASLKPEDIKCLAITTLRGSFITWKKDSGEYLHNFITWKDLRSKKLVEKWNNSILLKTIQSGAQLLYFFGRNDRYLMGSRLQLSTIQCTSRLLWIFQNIPEVKKAAQEQNLCFATLDTWLIHKLTQGKKYITEVTHAASTGLFDPFVMDWADWPKFLMGIPKDIYPEIVASDYDFGSTVSEIFGVAIPIKSVIADQQSSMFGTCCFKKDDIKITIGTGSFIDINTEFLPLASAENTYPLVSWALNNKPMYLTEASCRDAGSLIQWALSVGIASNISDISNQAYLVENSDGVFFIPAFSGLGAPLFDDLAATGFLGVKPTTTKNHLMRAILESIVYSIVSAYNTVYKHKRNTFREINVDGGVSKNDFVCQLLADIVGLSIIRYTSHEGTILGAAFLAGLNAGIWTNIEDLQQLKKIDKTFVPTAYIEEKERRILNMENWLKAIRRFQKWYT